MWATEVARRFPNSVVLLLHGGNKTPDEWYVEDSPNAGYGRTCTPVEIFLAKEREEYPGRTLVLISCNPLHLALHGFANVWYSPDETWVVPDRALTKEMMSESRFVDRKLDDPEDDIHFDEPPTTVGQTRWVTDPGVTGNVYEFLSAE